MKEKVSSRRGCSGRLAATTFSPDEGVTEFAAAVDRIGLWITDGVGILKNWSKDIDWDTHFANANLSTAVLIDNPEMRRLELIYDSDSAGAWKRFLIFYGQFKSNSMPKITGPNPTGFRCATYDMFNNNWTGWTGDDSSTGDVFNENTGVADAAQGNGANTNINFDVETKDFFPFRLKHAALVMFFFLKWSSPTVSKTVSVKATTTRENEQEALTVTRDYNVLNSNKMLVKKYGTKFAMRITDNSATALPGLVGAELTSRLLTGGGEDTAATV